ncbi:MAG: hypothetical protein PVH61_10875 [Candidatus Aminicenantes bacterium]|jgi:hypothetical protein
MEPDNEINALNSVYEAIKGLNNAQIKRILDWITSKFDLEKQPGLKAVEREAVPPPEPGPLLEASPGETAEPAVERVKKRRGRRPAQAKPVVEEPVLQPAAASELTGFINYDNFEELLLFSNANTNTAKILLAAAYLQEKKHLKEFGSYDISKLFKSIGEEVSQPSSSLNNLMSKKPPLLLQTGTQGAGLKSRRKFMVTAAGLKTARNYIKE